MKNIIKLTICCAAIICVFSSQCKSEPYKLSITHHEIIDKVKQEISKINKNEIGIENISLFENTNKTICSRCHIWRCSIGLGGPRYLISIIDRDTYIIHERFGEIFNLEPYWENILNSINKFNRFMKLTNVNIDEANIEKYIGTFLFIVGNGSVYVGQAYHHPFTVKPLTTIKTRNFISLEFFSYLYKYFTLKWKLEINSTGEILEYEVTHMGNLFKYYPDNRLNFSPKKQSGRPKIW